MTLYLQKILSESVAPIFDDKLQALLEVKS